MKSGSKDQKGQLEFDYWPIQYTVQPMNWPDDLQGFLDYMYSQEPFAKGKGKENEDQD